MDIAKPEGIFIGANSHTSASDYCQDRNEVAFGAGTMVALWSPLSAVDAGVFQTLKGHTDDVLNVKYIYNGAYLVSTSADKSVKVWMYENGIYKLHQSLEGDHEASVNCLSVSSSVGGAIVSTSSADGNVIIWAFENKSGKLVKLYAFTVGNNARSSTSFYALSLYIIEACPGHYVMFIGGTKPVLYVYSFTYSSEFSDFKQCAVLPGHENWIKALAARKTNENEYLIASGSLDRYIRLWKLNTAIDETADDNDGKQLSLLSNKKFKFTIGQDFQCSLNFEALILGHDDWISCLNWNPDPSKLQLMSTSADTSLMIWEPDAASGVWVTTARLGELSIKGASTATGASGGFWSSVWFEAPEARGQYILTHGKTGSWRVWSMVEDAASSAEWKQELGITGPFKQVTDVAWSRNQDYLLATSLDQTTRLFAPWKYQSDGSLRPAEAQTWREFSRPQIHGYDMVCVSSLRNSRFVSGGDEKVMRSFDEPKSVFKLLNRFSGVAAGVEEKYMPGAASLPVLGLSNKAEADGDVQNTEDNDDADEEAESRNISATVLAELQQPPLEDHLQRHTLWPELEKLYGHGYELTTLDTSHDSKYIVSCCKSNSVRHAVLRLFDSSRWLEIRPALQFHELTVTRVRFSADDRYILSVSRDRKIAIWEHQHSHVPYRLKFSNNKAHTRIIWDGDWAPLLAGYVFVSASRDKSIKVWLLSESGFDSIHQVKFAEPVTAVSVFKLSLVNSSNENIIFIAAGLESGGLVTYLFNLNTKKGILVENFDTNITPSGRINRLSWRSDTADKNQFMLAVGSADHSVRLFSVSSLDVNKLLNDF